MPEEKEILLPKEREWLLPDTLQETSSKSSKMIELSTPITTTTEPEYDDYDDEYRDDIEDADDEAKQRRRRETKDWGKMLSGACMEGCAFGFYAFTIVSAVINIFGASGRIGNLLVNYR